MLSMLTIMGECLNACIKPEMQHYLQNPREMTMSLRNNKSPSLDVTPSTQTAAKKSYTKPDLRGFGKVSSVTAAGSGVKTENRPNQGSAKKKP
jgi:hypothetical protein